MIEHEEYVLERRHPVQVDVRAQGNAALFQGVFADQLVACQQLAWDRVPSADLVLLLVVDDGEVLHVAT